MAIGRLERVRPSKEAPVEVRLDDARAPDALFARDLSAEGMALVVPRGGTMSEIAGAEVGLRIKLPGRRAFRARGSIRHDTEFRGERFVGVALTEIATEHRELLVGYVQERLRELDAADPEPDEADPPPFA